MRRCTICGELKPLGEFYSTHAGNYYCKACMLAKQKLYYLKNRKRVLSQQRQYNLKNREKKRLYDQQYRIDHRARLYAQNEKYRKEHPEFVATYRERQRIKMKTPEGHRRSRINSHIRRARKAQLPHDLTEHQWNIICNMFEYECTYCDQPLQLQQEHFVPVTKGGGYTISNIVPACQSCNQRKRARDPRDFINDDARYEAIVMLMSDAEYCIRLEDNLC